MRNHWVLGIHIGHDRGACLIQDGIVKVAISQERLDRIKYSRSYGIPFEAIDAVLNYCYISAKDITCIGVSCDAIEGDSILELIKHEYYEYYQSTPPLLMVNHHDAHAYATYFCSGFDDAIILVADGGGDYMGNMVQAETVYIAKSGTIAKIEQRLQAPTIRRIGDSANYIYPMMPSVVRAAQISIARKYEQFTYLLGFGWGEAGKTMGLASYGKPTFYHGIPKISGLNFSLTYEDLLKDIFAAQLLSGMPFASFMEKNRTDIACTIQFFTQQMIVSIIAGLLKSYNCKNLCLSGGLFLNCLSNQQVIEQCQLKSAFVLPCAGDDGQALGCAFYAYHHFVNAADKFAVNLPYLGLSYDEVEILEALQSHGLKYQRLDDAQMALCIAEHISQNKIVALHRGRTEIGPRALCHRSILANPTNRDMKDILNRRVKHREEFRPFAPTVTAEVQYALFELQCSSDYMLLATQVRKAYRDILASVVHVDNTARVQAVHKEQEPFVHDLLCQLEKKIGVSVVLNTSFNVAGEPIVESPLDAIRTYLKTEIDVLAIGNFLVESK